MRFSSVDYIKVNINLTETIYTAKKSITAKNSFIIRAFLSDNKYYYGEASPLEGFSVETELDVEEQLTTILPNLYKLHFSLNLTSINSALNKLELLPSLRFAFEQIILFYIANHSGSKDFFTSLIKTDFITINGLFSLRDSDYNIERVNSLINQGYDTIKIKIGINDFDDEYKALRTIFNLYQDLVNIRLDVNGKWTIDEALEHLELLADFNIEHIEDPCADIIDCMAVAEKSNISIAIDEPLKNFDNVVLALNNPNIKTLIIKPMLKGRLFDIIQLLNDPKYLDKNIIISSLFESSVSKSCLIFLASMQKQQIANGLSTFNFISNDLLKVYPQIGNNISFLPDTLLTPIDLNHLF